MTRYVKFCNWVCSIWKYAIVQAEFVTHVDYVTLLLYISMMIYYHKTFIHKTVCHAYPIPWTQLHTVDKVFNHKICILNLFAIDWIELGYHLNCPAEPVWLHLWRDPTLFLQPFRINIELRYYPGTWVLIFGFLKLFF